MGEWYRNPNRFNPNEWYSKEEVMEVLGITSEELKQLCQQGEIKPYTRNKQGEITPCNDITPDTYFKRHEIDRLRERTKVDPSIILTESDWELLIPRELREEE